MSERRLIEIGTFPVGQSETFAIGPDAVAAMLKAGIEKGDLARAEEERARAAAAADVERARNTRSARARRRFQKALALCRLR